MSLREEFESWFKVNAPQISAQSRRTDHEGVKAAAIRELCFHSWKASRAALVIELPALKNSTSYHDGGDQHDDLVNKIRKTVEAAGVKVNMKTHGFICVGGPLDGQWKPQEESQTHFDVAEPTDLSRFGLYSDENAIPVDFSVKFCRYVLKDHPEHGAAWVAQP